MDTGASATTSVLMAQCQRPLVSWHSSQCLRMVPLRLTERNPETTDIPTVWCSRVSCFILDFCLRFHGDQSSLWSGCHPSASLNAGFEIWIWSTSLVILAFLLQGFLLGKFSPGKTSLLAGFPEVASTQTFCSDILWFCERGPFALFRHASLFHGAGSCLSTGALFLKKEEDRLTRHHVKCLPGTISLSLHSLPEEGQLPSPAFARCSNWGTDRLSAQPKFTQLTSWGSRQLCLLLSDSGSLLSASGSTAPWLVARFLWGSKQPPWKGGLQQEAPEGLVTAPEWDRDRSQEWAQHLAASTPIHQQC